MRARDLITVNGGLYEYIRFDTKSNIHITSEVEIDEDGNLCGTYHFYGFTDEELANRGINLTEKQWIGLTEHFLRQDYDLTDEEISDAAEDIVCRCLRTPLVEELPNYIAEYMDR